MTFKNKKSKWLFLACIGMHKERKKNKKYLQNEKSDEMEQSSLSMSCTTSPDCDGYQSTGHPISVEATVLPLKMKQKAQSFGNMKGHSCEKTKMYSSQENLQKCVKAVIDCGICKVTMYSGATFKIENGAIIVSTSGMQVNKEEHDEVCEFSNCMPKSHEVEKKRKDVHKASQFNICRPETDEEAHGMYNGKQTAVILPTRHQSFAVEAGGNIVVDADDNTLINSHEDNCLGTSANSSLNTDFDTEPQSEVTLVKDIYSSNIRFSRSLGGSDTNNPSPEDSCSISLGESNFSSFDSLSSVGHETVVKSENIRTCTRSVNCFQDQIAGIENRKDCAAGIQVFYQRDVQCRDIQDANPLYKDYDTQSPNESGPYMTKPPVAFRGGTHQEGNTVFCQYQEITQLHTGLKYYALLQKGDKIQSTILSASTYPESLMKLDAPGYNSLLKTSPSIKNVSHQETSELVESTSFNMNSGCGCLQSLLSRITGHMSPLICLSDIGETMNHKNTCRSVTAGQDTAKMEGTMLKPLISLKKDVLAVALSNQVIDMPVFTCEERKQDTLSEHDEIGHTLSLQAELSRENMRHSLDIEEKLKEQIEISSVVICSVVKSPSKGGNYSFTEETETVPIGDIEIKELDSSYLKGTEGKTLNHNDGRLGCLSETVLARSIHIGHTNKTPKENGECKAQPELSGKNTTPECGSAASSSEPIGKANIGPILVTKDNLLLYSNTVVSSGSKMAGDKLGNKHNPEKDETVRSACKLKMAEADSCSNAYATDESCSHKTEKNDMALNSNTLNVSDTDCCLNTVDSDDCRLHGKDKVFNVRPVKTRFGFLHEMDPVIADREHTPGHGIPAQHKEEYWQIQASTVCSSDHCLKVEELATDMYKKELTDDSPYISDCDPKKPRAETFVSRSKVQDWKVPETRDILNKQRSLRRSKSGVTCRLCPLRKRRRGRKRKVKLKGSMKPSMRVSPQINLSGILSDLKILLHYMASSFAQDTTQSNTLNQTTKMRIGKPDFATEHGVEVSEKENDSQELLINEFLKSLVSTWFIFPTIKNGLQTVILLPTGLQLYFERLLRGTPPVERERMSYEWLRLQTFINYPSSAPGSGIRLSRAGFYYSGSGTVTTCYACGTQHSAWGFHDDPYEIHRRISPDCPFLRGNPTYPNVPIMQEGERNGIQIGNNTSNTSLSQTINLTMVNSPSNSNSTSEMSPPATFQSQNSTITQIGAQSFAATSPSIQNPQEGGSEQQASQKAMSNVDHSLGTFVPSSINPASSADVDEIPSVKDQPVTLTAAVVPNTNEESQQGQSPSTAATTLIRPQQPTDDAENTQYRSPGNFVLIKPPGYVENPGVNPTHQTMSERPRHPEYAPLSSRVNSYTGWPVHLDQTPQQMAEAGFFSAGIMDYTRCFQCGGGLRNWDPGDNPWIEHARWYPLCAYVLGKRGQKFVNAVLKKQAELLAAQGAERNNSNTTTTATNTSYGTTSKTGTQSAQQPATQLGQPRYFQNPNENEIANRLINEMGYQRERVQEAILEVKRRGQQEIAVEHVIELLLADEERRTRAGKQNEPASVEELIQESGRLTLHDDNNTPPTITPPTAKTTTTTQSSPSGDHMNQVAGGRSSGQQQNGQKSGQTNQPLAPGRGPSVPQSLLNMSGPMSIAVDVPSSSFVLGNQEASQSNKSTASNRPSSPPPLEPTSLPAFTAELLREEYLQLRDQNLCKICMERNVELVFLPCGHVVCCEVCGQTFRFCPICRAKIHASVKTYLS